MDIDQLYTMMLWGKWIHSVGSGAAVAGGLTAVIGFIALAIAVENMLEPCGATLMLWGKRALIAGVCSLAVGIGTMAVGSGFPDKEDLELYTTKYTKNTNK